MEAPLEHGLCLNAMTTKYEERILEIGAQARNAARALARATTAEKNTALLAAADQIERSSGRILAANETDMKSAKASDLASAMLDRLRLDIGRISAIARSVRQVAALPDPVGSVIREWDRGDGLEFAKVRVPIGVIGIIYESRPNVTSDAASLCLKTGNAVVLRGGSESLGSNLVIAEALREGCREAGIIPDAIQIIDLTDRGAVRAMAEMDQYIDLIIPRGGKELIEAVTKLARMPVIKHYDGVCHIYVDRAADLAMAESIVINAKCQRPSVCNAVETLLVHRDIADAFLRSCGHALQEHRVELHGDGRSHHIQVCRARQGPLERLTHRNAHSLLMSPIDLISPIRPRVLYIACAVTSPARESFQFLLENSASPAPNQVRAASHSSPFY